MSSNIEIIKQYINFKFTNLVNNPRFEGTLHVNGTVVSDSITVDDINGTSVIDELNMINNLLEIGTDDPLDRPQIRYIKSNDPDPDNSGNTYAGLGNVLRLGSSTSHGDNLDIISEGIIIYGQNNNGDMNSGPNNFGYALTKPLTFQLRESIAGVEQDIFLVNSDQIKFRATGEGSDSINVTNSVANLNIPINMNNNNISGVNILTTGSLKTTTYTNSYYAFTCNFTDVDDTLTASDTHVMINTGDISYVGSVNLITGEMSFAENGIYGLTLYINNTTALSGSDIFKVEIQDSGGTANTYARTIATRNQDIGDLNVLVSATIPLLSTDHYMLYCSRISGTGVESFNCVMTVTRIK